MPDVPEEEEDLMAQLNADVNLKRRDDAENDRAGVEREPSRAVVVAAFVPEVEGDRRQVMRKSEQDAEEGHARRLAIRQHGQRQHDDGGKDEEEEIEARRFDPAPRRT